MTKLSIFTLRFFTIAFILQSAVFAQADKIPSRFRIHLSGLFGSRVYTGEAHALDAIARSKYAYGYSASFNYTIPMKPKVDIGLEWSVFYDYVRWRRDWIPEENTAKDDMTGEKEKFGRSLKLTSELYLFREERFVNPYVGASFGLFWADLNRFLTAGNTNLYSEPETRPLLSPDKNLDYNYKGYALELKAGISKEFSFIPAGIFLEIRRSYHIISTPGVYGTRGDDNLNYYAFAFGLMFSI